MEVLYMKEKEERLKVLFASGEALPFAKTGGLGDVVGSLPHSLYRNGVDCRVVIPLYGPTIKDEKGRFKHGEVNIDKQKLKFIKEIYVPVSGRIEYCGIFEAEHNGVTYYLLDNLHYFERDTMYEEYDNAERFAFFSRAVLEILPHIDFKPDVINANDWHTALVPIYQHVFYSQSDWYSGIKTAFTIHNIAHQGKYGLELLGDIFSLSKSEENLVEYDGIINLMKGALVTAHSVITVSEKYSKEIAGDHTDDSGYDFGQGLTPIIKSIEEKLNGILNGLDENYDPRTDQYIYKKYDINSFKEGKAENKRKLQEALGLEQKEDAALIGIVTRIDEQKGCEHIIEAFKNGLLELMAANNAQFVVLGNPHSEKLKNDFEELKSSNKGRIAAEFGLDTELAQKIYAASDIYLMPSQYEPCGLAQMIAMRYGSIPVVRETGGLFNSVTDSQDGKGNGFTYKNFKFKDLLGAISRALGGYTNHQGWEILTKRAMERDFSWDAGSVGKYIELFKSL